MISDQDQRGRAVEETEHSLVVEASAGTGKTSALIERILHLVLQKGPTGSPLPLTRICAITFTEKAAGEMKVRLRQQFEEAASHLDPAGKRAREALQDLETASISTFHAFAVSLLKERPIEAGVDPHFTALDEIQSSLFFREVWEGWINRALTERQPVLEQALCMGLRLDALEDLARTLRFNARAVRMLKPDAPPTDDWIREQIEGLAQRGRAFIALAHTPEDKLAVCLEKALNWLDAPGQSNTMPDKPGSAGSAANWDGGKETVHAVRSYTREVVEFVPLYKRLPSLRVLNDLITWMSGDLLAEWESRKRARGLLDFDDQVGMARDLLIGNRAVRREFQQRYAALLVDEFQDTDPIQWEIVLLLSSANLDESDPNRLQPEPGRLFIVGDPKQSIYRFRRADIETYLGIVDPPKMQGLGLEKIQLTKNYRSVPSILRFVDAVFADAMISPADGRYQPDYLSFGNEGNRSEELSPPSVYILGDKSDEADTTQTVRKFLGREASRVVKLITQMRGGADWEVFDSSSEGDQAWRAPRYGDMAILLPVLTRVDIFEDALREAEIPYVLEGGKFYYARSEVSSALTILRAVANPNDAVALYGSLRSIFFGLSDEDLLRAHIDGQPFDYRREIGEESPLFHPYEVLRDLHQYRHERRASETLEILLQKTGAREVLAAHGFQSLANLSKLVRTLRALQGEVTFSQVIELLQKMDEEGLAESESRLMEERSDAVRVMSIHKAKGLDFPIVFVAGLGLKKLVRSGNFLADHHQRKVFALSVGPKELGLQTPGWKELVEAEKKRENAELVRLLYVGLTRARDHLILCTHTRSWKKLQGTDQLIPNVEGTRLKPLSSFLADCYSQGTNLANIIDTASLDAASSPRQVTRKPKRQDWGNILKRQYQELHTLLRNTPSARDLRAPAESADSSGGEDHPAEDRLPDAVRDRAIRIGVAFHEAMERIDFFQLASVADWAGEAGARHKLDEESVHRLKDMLHQSLTSNLIERACQAVRSGGRILRELPFVRPLNCMAIEEGKIDLLFEEAGGWVLVDYKTDALPQGRRNIAEYFRDKYVGQIRAYAEALAALPVKVEAAYLLLARTGDSIEIPLS